MPLNIWQCGINQYAYERMQLERKWEMWSVYGECKTGKRDAGLYIKHNTFLTSRLFIQNNTVSFRSTVETAEWQSERTHAWRFRRTRRRAKWLLSFSLKVYTCSEMEKNIPYHSRSHLNFLEPLHRRFTSFVCSLRQVNFAWGWY